MTGSRGNRRLCALASCGSSFDIGGGLLHRAEGLQRLSHTHRAGMGMRPTWPGRMGGMGRTSTTCTPSSRHHRRRRAAGLLLFLTIALLCASQVGSSLTTTGITLHGTDVPWVRLISSHRDTRHALPQRHATFVGFFLCFFFSFFIFSKRRSRFFLSWLRLALSPSLPPPQHSTHTRSRTHINPIETRHTPPPCSLVCAPIARTLCR